MMIYKEGKAKIKYYNEAFLNPKALLSRDLSIAFINAVINKDSKGLSAIDTTSATGIRGIRYYKETGIKNITMLEINKTSFNELSKNIKYNKLENKISIFNTSMQEFANSLDHERYNFIDLDPFGSAAPDLNDIMKLAKDGSYGMITSTDVAVLCGAHYDACLKVYSAQPLHNEMCHEVGIRILIGAIARTASLFNFGIKPEISISYLHYMRVFIKFKHGALNAVNSYKNTGYISYCKSCGNFEVSKLVPKNTNCNICGNRYVNAGPLWIGKIQDNKTVMKVKDIMENSKIYPESEKKFISSISNEIDYPLYYHIPSITKMMGVKSVSYKKVMDNLVKLGFEVSKTHMSDESIKTDANISEVKAAIMMILNQP